MRLLNSKRSTVFVALAMAVLMFASVGVAAAAPAAPTVTADSDIDEDVTIDLVDADEDTVSTLEISTDTADDVESATVEIEHTDRESVHYEADLDSDEYELVEEDNADGEDIHQWEISHDEFADVPAQINEDVGMTATITVENDEGDSETSVEFTLANDEERSVMYVDDAAIDDDEIDGEIGVDADAFSVTEDTNFLGFGGEETNYDVYHIDADREFATFEDEDEETHVSDIEIAFDDDEAEAFDQRAAATSTDLAPMLTMTFDDEVAFVFADDVNEDIVDTDQDTYGVYDTDESTLMVSLGEDYEGDVGEVSEASLHVGNHAPNALDSVGVDETVQFAEHMSLFNALGDEPSLMSAFGNQGGFAIFSEDVGIPLIGMASGLFAGGLVVRTRRRTEA